MNKVVSGYNLQGKAQLTSYHFDLKLSCVRPHFATVFPWNHPNGIYITQHLYKSKCKICTLNLSHFLAVLRHSGRKSSNPIAETIIYASVAPSMRSSVQSVAPVLWLLSWLKYIALHSCAPVSMLAQADRTVPMQLF